MQKIRGRRGILEVDAANAVDMVFSQTHRRTPQDATGCHWTCRRTPLDPTGPYKPLCLLVGSTLGLQICNN